MTTVELMVDAQAKHSIENWPHILETEDPDVSRRGGTAIAGKLGRLSYNRNQGINCRGEATVTDELEESLERRQDRDVRRRGEAQ